MKILLKFLFIVFLVIGIPAILAPLIFPLVESKYPFERVLSRLVMIFGFIAIAVFIKKDLRIFQQYGFTSDKNFYRWIGWGLLFGIGTLVSLALFESFMGVYDVGLRVKWDRIPERVFKALCTGLLVATLEEFFFRGFIFLTLCKVMTRFWSFIITNSLYSVVHFFRGTKQPWDEPSVADSFSVLISWLKPLGDWQHVLPNFFGLLLFGCILSYVFVKTKSLYMAIGIHAGVVLFLKVDVNFFAAKGTSLEWLYGGGDYYGGVIPWIFLLGLWGAAALFLKKKLEPNENTHH